MIEKDVKGAAGRSLPCTDKVFHILKMSHFKQSYRARFCYFWSQLNYKKLSCLSWYIKKGWHDRGIAKQAGIVCLLSLPISYQGVFSTQKKMVHFKRYEIEHTTWTCTYVFYKKISHVFHAWRAWLNGLQYKAYIWSARNIFIRSSVYLDQNCLLERTDHSCTWKPSFPTANANVWTWNLLWAKHRALPPSYSSSTLDKPVPWNFAWDRLVGCHVQLISEL